MIEKIKKMYEELSYLHDSKAIIKMSQKLYKDLPEDDDEFIDLMNSFVESNDFILFQMMTTWIKKRKCYSLKYFEIYEKWLYENIKGWGECDQFCYRVLNPMLEKHIELFKEVKKWSNSDKTYVKRASAVCLLQSKGTFVVNVPFEYVKEICNQLLTDSHIHVQKGIGWLLKYIYLSYNVEVVKYLNDNIKNMSRTTFRYALEKMPIELKNEMMNK